MTTPFTIIAATNFSAIADNAVTYAAELAKATGAKLILFHSFSLTVHSANSLITAEGLQKQITKRTNKLEAIGEEVANLHNIEVSVICSYAFLEEQLSLIIEETNANLVVMGMAERSLEQDILGNSTTSVIKNLDIPVLAVPQNARFISASKILYACDVLSLSAIKKFSWLRQIVETLGAEIEFFSIEGKLDNLKKEQEQILLNTTIKEEFKEVKYIYKTVKSNAVISEIHKEIKYCNADILVMAPRKYGFWDSLVHRSKTRIMAAGLHIPLLSFPNF
ncbi:universal stress protein [Flavobacterium sp. F-65]|jgi:nucleotide-binding universal stress UspA family protein|uniref:Universal stress protein n=1 Tax=Flavobacterium pisciphilum TaxID=2893755 RepID=A0ABS8MPS5_9FLAO|nr:universal stress protein [Flavobacterium sp. F-65]MCC9070774.1 universal stress protein [Flavobacterium sp. F-65]